MVKQSSKTPAASVPERMHLAQIKIPPGAGVPPVSNYG